MSPPPRDVFDKGEAAPYLDLPTTVARSDIPDNRRAVFITGRFRSGTTLLWNLFRQAEGFTSYYEPLNERRWFDADRRGERIDQSHLGVDNYWSEYEGLTGLGTLFSDKWHDRHLWMDGHFADEPLRQYLGELIRHAPLRPVLQFNRMDFRLPWLRQQFPSAYLIHIYRHPRDQWLSTIGGPHRATPDITLQEYDALDGFYLLLWAHDLKYRFGFLDPARHERPYLLYYLIWKLSYRLGRQMADHSMSVESLWTDPVGELRRLFDHIHANDVDLTRLSKLVTPQTPGKWRHFAAEEWFYEQELEAEGILQSYATTCPDEEPLLATRHHIASHEQRIKT